ncbi:MAG: type III-A CRISPR-associated protein Cas10/Csm1 [Cytophagales bacterium]|nr:type III-A CRISPR-associated protein Cas10/Csm1 [Cytophagales bacterium]
MTDQKRPTRTEIYIAALLHDIGKFYQRADDYDVKNSKLLSADTKNLESVFCPLSEGIYTHKHVLWTYQFFADFASSFKAAGLDWEEVATLAASHHKPNSNRIEQVVLQTAYQLASATERSSKDSDDENSNFKTTPLRLIFDFLKVPGGEGETITHVPLQKLSLESSFVLRKSINGENYRPTVDEYKQLWQSFTNEFKHIWQDIPENFAEAILTLLHVYTTTIPATTTDLPDVSLYDHSRVVAALALCLYDWLELEKNLYQEEDLRNKLGALEAAPFLLVGGQISGIQSFIYNIIAKYAAKNLKGRSFYLELLCDDAVSYIVSELRLFSGNIIYNSGGNFYLLAPNTPRVIEKVDEIECRLQKQLFYKHKIDLSLILATQPVSIGNLNNKEIGEPWEQLFRNIDAKKLQKHRLVLEKNFNSLFTPQKVLKNRDVITGEEIDESETKKLDDEEELTVSKYTYEQISLGYHLKDAVAIIETSSPEDYFEKYARKQHYPNVCDPILEVGSTYYLVDENGLESIKKVFENRKGTVKRIIGLNHFDISLVTGFEKLQSKIPAWSFKLYGGNTFPVVTISQEDGEEKETEPKTFSEMAGMPEKGRKYDGGFNELKLKRLGVLRMDVDNLGMIFSEGFKGQETLARFASLSRQMDLFFKGYLNTIRNSDEKFRDNLLILYAGGDDLFVVGLWSEVIRFARKVREDFMQFTNRRDITISGGIAILPPKFPIGKAAVIAGEAEEKAKSFNNNAKNAICIFEQPISWEQEFSKVEELKERMVKLRRGGKLTASFLQHLIRFQIIKNRHETNPKYADKPDLSYVWNAAYTIGRYKERVEKGSETWKFLDTVQKHLFEGEDQINRDRFFDLYGIAARWAELELRSKS